MNERTDTAVINEDRMPVYQEMGKPCLNYNLQNIFKNGNDNRSESSDANSFISAPKFGGVGTNSDRGSIALSFKSPYFRVDRQHYDRNGSSKKSSGMDSELHQES